MQKLQIWFEKLKLGMRTRLLLGFGTVIVLFMATCGVALWSLNSYLKDAGDAQAIKNSSLAATTVGSTLRAEALAFTDGALRRGTMIQGNFRTQNTKLNSEQFPALLKSKLSDAQRDQVNTLISQHTKLEELYNAGIADATNLQFDNATAQWVSSIQPVMDSIVYRATKLSDQLTQEAFERVDQANSRVADLQKLALLALVIAVVLGIMVTWSTIKATVIQNNRLKSTLENLQIANKEIEKRQLESQQVSTQVLSLATELNSTAGEQAIGSRQQVLFVTEVNTTLNELFRTAANIAEMADKVNYSANSMVSDSQQIEEIGNLSVQESEFGQEMVGNTVEASVSVASRYQLLLDKINELSAKNSSMRVIVDLINSLANEIHLLSLNAAIEAAGAGEYGQRFSIVAQEMKHLATRSSKAGQEVVGIIRQIEGATREAVEVTRNGYDQALDMEKLATRTGEVIHKMREVAEDSHRQANSISLAAREVKELVEVVKGSTAQQRVATEQVLQSLNELKIVAEQSAAGNNNISRAAVNLEELSQNLNLALAA